MGRTAGRAGRSGAVAVRARHLAVVACGVLVVCGLVGSGGEAAADQRAQQPSRDAPRQGSPEPTPATAPAPARAGAQAGVHSAAGPPGDVALGRRLYHRGVGEDGREVLAAVGEQGVELPASALPCASCHGDDGRSPVEQGGSLLPPALTREALGRPASGAEANGRDRPAYQPRTLKRAVTMGLDPAGHRLDTVMPRYRLTHAEAAALVAYLGTLGDGGAGGESSDGGRAGADRRGGVPADDRRGSGSEGGAGSEPAADEVDGSAAVAADPPDGRVNGGSSAPAADAPAGSEGSPR